MLSEWLGIVSDMWVRAPWAVGFYLTGLALCAGWTVYGLIRCYRCK